MPTSQIFLCGGRTDQAASHAPSVREALLRHLPKRNSLGSSNIILAERANEALPDSNFTNLLDLEECIAAIVDAVVLIVESAGSICELGAFAKTDEIRRKMLIIIPNEHDNVKSFIKLGPLKYMRDISSSSEIHPFDWNFINSILSVPEYSLDGMITEISNSVSKIERNPKFDKILIGHRIYLTLAFCHLLRGAKLNEIKECFRMTTIDDITDRDIKKYLDTLQICGLVERASNGSKHVHFIPKITQLPIKAAFQKNIGDEKRDILRWIQSIAADILQEDPVRMKMFQRHNHAN